MMKMFLRFSKSALNIFIFSSAALIIAIIWSGGFEFQVIGKRISCHTLVNPSILFVILILLRFFLGIGLKNSLTFILALFFTALVAEILLRVLNPPMSFPALKNLTEYSPILGYKLAPSLKDRYIRTNSLGLRDRELRYNKPEGVRRILGVGDSFTFGYKVQLKDCYLKQLEFQLSQHRDKWEVINAGVTGYNMWQYLAYFKHYGYKFEPDFVSIGIYFDDFYGDPSTSERHSAPERYHSLYSIRLINFSRNLVDLIQYRYRYLFDAKWLKSIEDRFAYIEKSQYNLLLTGRADPKLYQKFEERLKEFASLAKANNTKVFVIFIPDVIQLNNQAFQAVNRKLKDICRRCTIELIDITPIFEAISDIKNLYLLPHDAHISPLGHQIIAEEVGRRMKDMNIQTDRNAS